MKMIQPHTMVGDLTVVYTAVQHLPQWYVATADGILIFGPFSSFEEAMETGRATYWSRSRQELWVKGASSGSVQHVRDLRVDCDGDCLLLKVDQTGAACHEGYRTCFFRAATPEGRVSRVGEPLTDPY